jgi:hypothetical protein
VYIDGAPVRRYLTGRPGVLLGPASVDEVTVTTGAVDVRLPDARGGALSFLTRAGAHRLGGSFRAATDDAFSGVGVTRFDGTIGGPLPLGSGATWIVGGTLLGQREHYTGIGASDLPSFMPSGIDTVVGGFPVRRFEDRRAFDWGTDLRLHGKVVVPFGNLATLNITGLVNESQERFFPGTLVLDSALYSGSRAAARMLIANWRQRLTVVAGGLVSLQLLSAISDFSDASGPLDPASEQDTRDPSLGITLETLRFNGADSITMPLRGRIIRNMRTNTGLRVPYLDRLDLRPFQPTRANPFGMVASWPEAGTDGVIDFRTEQTRQARGFLEWATPTGIRARLGLDGDVAEVSTYRGELLTLNGLDAYRSQPNRVGVFYSHAVDRGRLAVEGGIRYDRYGSLGFLPTVPGRIFSHPAWNPAASTDDSAYTNSIDRVFTRARAHGGISLRLGVDLLAARGTLVRASFGRRLEQPPLGVVLAHKNSDLTFTSTSAVFGRDIEYGSSTMLELGVRRDVIPGLTAHLGAYRKSYPAYEARVTPFADPVNVGDTINLVVVGRAPDPIVIGGELSLDWEPREWFAATATYARWNTDLGHGPVLTGSKTFTTQTLSAGVTARARTGRLAGFAGSALLRLTSGIAYNPTTDFTTLTPDVSAVFAGSPRYLPWTKRLDLRLSRVLRSGPGEWSIFAEGRNLFGWRNILSAFRANGGVTNDLFRESVIAPEVANLRAEAGNAGALGGDGMTITIPTDCGGWNQPVNCEAIRRVEQRFGNGDGTFTDAEQRASLTAYYNRFFGPTTFYGAGRTVRLGVEIRW